MPNLGALHRREDVARLDALSGIDLERHDAPVDDRADARDAAGRELDDAGGDHAGLARSAPHRANVEPGGLQRVVGEHDVGLRSDLGTGRSVLLLAARDRARQPERQGDEQVGAGP